MTFKSNFQSLPVAWSILPLPYDYFTLSLCFSLSLSPLELQYAITSAAIHEKMPENEDGRGSIGGREKKNLKLRHRVSNPRHSALRDDPRPFRASTESRRTGIHGAEDRQSFWRPCKQVHLATTLIAYHEPEDWVVIGHIQVLIWGSRGTLLSCKA